MEERKNWRCDSAFKGAIYETALILGHLIESQLWPVRLPTPNKGGVPKLQNFDFAGHPNTEGLNGSWNICYWKSDRSTTSEFLSPNTSSSFHSFHYSICVIFFCLFFSWFKNRHNLGPFFFGADTSWFFIFIFSIFALEGAQWESTKENNKRENEIARESEGVPPETVNWLRLWMPPSLWCPSVDVTPSPLDSAVSVRLFVDFGLWKRRVCDASAQHDAGWHRLRFPTVFMSYPLSAGPILLARYWRLQCNLKS